MDMSTLGRSIVVKGEVRCTEGLTIEGRVDGPVSCQGHAIVIAESAHVSGDVIARDITVMGHVTGQLIATDIVDVRASATVSGQVLSPRFILNDGATFRGRVEPQHLEAALRVANFQERRKGSA